jgi:hypothetical protein
MVRHPVIDNLALFTGTLTEHPKLADIAQDLIFHLVRGVKNLDPEDAAIEGLDDLSQISVYSIFHQSYF